MNRACFETVERKPQDDGIEFSLTQRERDIAAFGTVHLERLRREANRRDNGNSLARALARAQEET